MDKKEEQAGVNIMNLIKYETLPLYQWIILGILLFSQSIWLFRDAQKRKAYPWLWGIWGLTGVPTPLIVYLIVVRKILKKRK